MSDLAPFVAAVVRDKTIADLLEENEKLRWRVEANRQDVELTGPGGVVVYVGYDRNGSITVQRCTLHDLKDLEVHIRGMGKVLTFRDMTKSGNWTCHFDGESFWLKAQEGSSTTVSLLSFELESSITDDEVDALVRMDWDNHVLLENHADVLFEYVVVTESAMATILEERRPQVDGI